MLSENKTADRWKEYNCQEHEMDERITCCAHVQERALTWHRSCDSSRDSHRELMHQSQHETWAAAYESESEVNPWPSPQYTKVHQISISVQGINTRKCIFCRAHVPKKHWPEWRELFRNSDQTKMHGTSTRGIPCIFVWYSMHFRLIGVVDTRNVPPRGLKAGNTHLDVYTCNKSTDLGAEGCDSWRNIHLLLIRLSPACPAQNALQHSGRQQQALRVLLLHTWSSNSSMGDMIPDDGRAVF